MQGFKAYAVDINQLGENMPNIKLWSDIAPCNINKVLPYKSILCLSNFKMGKGCHNYEAVLKTYHFILKVRTLPMWNSVQCPRVTASSVFSGRVFGGSKQIMAAPVRKGLYLPAMHYSPQCRGRK